MGMMDKVMALDEESAAQEAAHGSAPGMPEAQEPMEPAGAPEAMNEPEGEEISDEDFEGSVERALAAAVRVMQSDQVKGNLKQLLQNPDAESIARFALDLLRGIVERSKDQVSEDAVPAIAFELIIMIADLGEVPQRVIAEATQRLLLMYLQSQGVAQPEIEQVLQAMDFDGMAQAAANAE